MGGASIAPYLDYIGLVETVMYVSWTAPIRESDLFSFHVNYQAD